MPERQPAELPKQVIRSWEQLVNNSKNAFVTVNHDVLDSLSAQNPDLVQPDWRIPGMHPDNDWAFATQITLADSINFMFLNRDIERHGESWTMHNPDSGSTISGSNALMIRTLDYFGEAEDITAKQIESLASKHTFDTFLKDIPLAETRRRILAEFALGLRNTYGGSVRELINASVDHNGDLRIFNNSDGFVERLRSENFGSAFADTSCLGDLTFPFDKRANLTPILIDGRARTSLVLPRFADIEQSGAVPDYRLPQALRAMGAIAYSSDLAARVDNWIPIEAESQEEIEIRAATAYSAQYLLDKTNAVRAQLHQELYNMAHVDFWLWQKGRELKKSGDQSLPHYTETSAY